MIESENKRTYPTSRSLQQSITTFCFLGWNLFSWNQVYYCLYVSVSGSVIDIPMKSLYTRTKQNTEKICMYSLNL